MILSKYLTICFPCERCGKLFKTRDLEKTFCNKCVKIRREKNREYRRKYYQKNADKVREANRKWEQENPEKMRECKRKWRQENPEKLRKKMQKWRQENPEKERKRCRKYYWSNVEYRRKYQREYKRKRRKKIKAEHEVSLMFQIMSFGSVTNMDIGKTKKENGDMHLSIPVNDSKHLIERVVCGAKGENIWSTFNHDKVTCPKCIEIIKKM